MKVIVCHFSATGNTETIARTITARLEEAGAEVTRMDITTPDARKKGLDMSAYDAAVFGAPIHSMRAPRLVREWIAGLDGGGKKCALFFTYGGFQIHPAPHDTVTRLQDRDFAVVGAATFTGAHSFNQAGWQSLPGRPAENDHNLAKSFADAVYKRFTGEDAGMLTELDKGPYTEEQLDQFENFRFKVLTKFPTRDGVECSMCMICEERCPSGAMNAETGEADPKKCIACLGCVKNCPDEVLHVNDISGVFKKKLEADKETTESLERKQGSLFL